MKRYPIYRSTSARVSQRLGAVAVPVGILAVLANRAALIGPSEMVYSVLAGACLGLVAFILALVAFYRLWLRGGVGAPRAVLGAISGLLAVVPLGVFAGQAIFFPGMADVSTDWRDPPELKAVAPAADQLPSGLMTTLFPLPGPREQRDLFPDIVPRRYRIAPGQLHAAVMEVAERNGWDITYELPPDLLDAPTGLQVIARTPILGLKEDMVLRIRPDPVGTLMDVRSASRFRVQGLTGNAERIRQLFSRVDEVLLETYGDLEHITVADGEQLGAEADTVGTADNPPQAGEVERIPVPAFKPYFEGEDADVPDTDLTDGMPSELGLSG